MLCTIVLTEEGCRSLFCTIDGFVQGRHWANHDNPCTRILDTKVTLGAKGLERLQLNWNGLAPASSPGLPLT